jgi:hypothetical protein
MFAIRHLHLAMAGTRRQARCNHPQRAGVAAAHSDVVWWAKSCYTMRPNEHLSVSRLLRTQRCRQVEPAATEGDDKGTASDDRGEGPDDGTRTRATSDTLSEVDSKMCSYPYYLEAVAWSR